MIRKLYNLITWPFRIIKFIIELPYKIMKFTIVTFIFLTVVYIMYLVLTTYPHLIPLLM